MLAVTFCTGREAEMPTLHELNDLATQHGIRIYEPRQRTVQKALAQTCKGPGPGIFESWWPMAVDITGPHGFVE